MTPRLVCILHYSDQPNELLAARVRELLDDDCCCEQAQPPRVVSRDLDARELRFFSETTFAEAGE